MHESSARPTVIELLRLSQQPTESTQPADETPAEVATAPEAPDYIPGRLTYGVRAAYLTVILLPLLGLLAGIVLMWGWGFTWLHLGMMVVGYVVTAIGVTVGYHRLFTHKSFETTAPVRFMLAVMGSMALEGPVMKWAAIHRRHHQHSDETDDPHSPHGHGKGLKGMMAGFWHAHIGWVFERDPENLSRYVTDLMADKVIRFQSKTWLLWALLGGIVPTVIAGLVTMSWKGALLGFLWGGLARVFVVHHITWSINSVCHIWGTKPFRSHDESRNNFLFGLIGLGEGWHNNHHAFPTSARHGLRWWEFDASYWIIKSLSLVGLAWKVRVPSKATIEAKRVMTAPSQPAAR